MFREFAFFNRKIAVQRKAKLFLVFTIPVFLFFSSVQQISASDNIFKEKRFVFPDYSKKSNKNSSSVQSQSDSDIFRSATIVPKQNNSSAAAQSSVSTEADIYVENANAESPKYSDVLSKYKIELNEDEALILQVNLGNRFIINDFLVGYFNEKNIFLPFHELMKALEFPIDVDSDAGKADGWFINEDRTISLDVRQNKLVSDGKNYKISPKSVIIYGQDIYLNIKLIEKIFPIQIKYDSLDQVLRVTSLENLPIEQRLIREERWSEVQNNQKLDSERNKSGTNSVSIIDEYKFASVPLTDIRYRYGHNYNADMEGHDSSSNLDVLMNGDFLYLNNSLFATMNNSEVSSVRYTAGRKDPNAKLLGPMKATEFSLGDVYTPQLPLTLRSQIGKGATVTNYPENYVTEFNTTTIRGNANPGWEVELYRDDTLLNFQTVGSDGIYEFTDVPLLSGQNEVRLYFYGPFGQRREETRRFLVNEEIIKKNKFYYRFASNKNNENLIKTGNEEITETAKDGKERHFGEVAYGVTDNTSIAANLSQVPLDITGEMAKYGGASLRSSFLGVYGRYDYVQNLDDKSNATQLSLQTNIKDFNISGSYSRFSEDFISEENQASADPLVDTTSLKLDFPLFSILKSTRLSIEGERKRYISNDIRDELNTVLSSRIGRNLNLTQEVRYISDDKSISETSSDKTTTGKTSVSYRVNDRFTLRGSLFYELDPSFDMDSSTVSANYNFKNDLTLNLNANRQHNEEGSNNYSASVSKNFKHYIASIGTNYDENGSYGADFNLSMAFGYDPKFGTTIVTPTAMSETGAISAKVFIDENNNSIHDENEQLLEGIGFTTNSGSQKQLTDENGTVMIPRIPTGYPVKVKLQVDQLGDPYLVPKRDEYTIVTHAGAITNLEFPITPVGEIEGYVEYKKPDGSLEPASNVLLELIGESGKVANIRSAYDGYYILENVPYGKYKFQPSKEQLSRLDKGSATSYDITLSDKDPTMSGFNFVINDGYIKDKKYNIKNIGVQKQVKFNVDMISKGDNVIRYIYTPVIKYKFKKGEESKVNEEVKNSPRKEVKSPVESDILEEVTQKSETVIKTESETSESETSEPKKYKFTGEKRNQEVESQAVSEKNKEDAAIEQNQVQKKYILKQGDLGEVR